MGARLPRDETPYRGPRPRGLGPKAETPLCPSLSLRTSPPSNLADVKPKAPSEGRFGVPQNPPSSPLLPSWLRFPPWVSRWLFLGGGRV